MVIVFLLIFAFFISKKINEKMLLIVPVMFAGISLVATNIIIVFNLSEGNIRLLGAWESVTTSLLFPHFYGYELVVKNVFMLSMFLPLFCMIHDKREYKRIILLLIACVIMLFSASENELLSIRPYYTNGVMFGAAVVYLILYLEQKRKFYLIGSITLITSCCLENRIGIISTLAFFLAFIVYGSIRLMLHSAERCQKTDWYIYILSIVFWIAIFYAFRLFVIGNNSFRKDVFNTYLNAIFTTHRYSVVPLWGLSYFHFLIILLLLIILCHRDNLKDIRWKMCSILYIWNIVLIMLLSFLYMTSYAADNFANYDEYLTFFADYIQCPVVVMLYYFGFSYSREAFTYEKVSKK